VIGALRSLPRRQSALLVLALVALVIVGAARDRAEHPPSAIDTFSTYETATGGYRAAYELLERIGVRVERFERRPAFLDASIATLAYVDPLPFDPHQLQPTRADIAALEGWVRGGGTLLYIGDDDAAAASGVLHLPRVVRRERAHKPAIAAELRAAGVARVLSSASPRYAAGRARRRVLLDDGRGALVVAYAYGRGRVTAVVDRTLFANVGIATGDRARLLVALATPARGGVLAFDEMAHGYATPEHWWTVVPRPFAFAVVFGGLVLLAGFAGAAVRLGPPLVPPVRDDRSSADFIEALAALYQRKAAAGDTLRDVAHATTGALARALGLDARASNEAVAAALGGAGLRAAFAELHALAAGASATESDLVRGVALAYQLRKDHAAYDRSGH